MSTTTLRMTAQEFFAFPEAHGQQLIGGELVVCVPKPMHQIIAVQLLAALHNWIEAGKCRGLVMGETGLPMDEHNVFAPDLTWFSEANVPQDLHEYPERVPDLCVEIRSPGTWRYDVGTKKTVYEACGLPELWLVDVIAEVVLVFRRSTPASSSFDVSLELDRAQTLTSPPLPGFSLPLDRLFRSRQSG